MSIKITYTKHAKEMLLFRKITKSLIEKCLKNPDNILLGKHNRKIYIKNFGKNDLKVVAILEKEIVIITCHWIAHGRMKV